LDIDSWLRGIGLEQYAQTFRDNAIDADVLRDLTDEHLRELGLVARDRRRDDGRGFPALTLRGRYRASDSRLITLWNCWFGMRYES
jgi:hypothetical protein